MLIDRILDQPMGLCRVDGTVRSNTLIEEADILYVFLEIFQGEYVITECGSRVESQYDAVGIFREDIGEANILGRVLGRLGEEHVHPHNHSSVFQKMLDCLGIVPTFEFLPSSQSSPFRIIERGIINLHHHNICKLLCRVHRASLEDRISIGEVHGFHEVRERPTDDNRPSECSDRYKDACGQRISDPGWYLCRHELAQKFHEFVPEIPCLERIADGFL